MQLLFQDWEKYQDKIPQLADLNNLDPPMAIAFERAAHQATHYRGADNDDEPFYMDEQRAELGFAFEKQAGQFHLDASLRTNKAASSGAALWTAR